MEPFYFLHGPETFYQTEVIQALIQKCITEDNRYFNLETFDARESTVNHWLGSARTLSFLGGIKLVVVRNLHEAIPKDQDAQTLIDYAQSPIPEACVVITADKVDRKRKLFKTLTGLKTAVACEAPKENELASWLRKRAGETGYSLSPDAARFLVNRVGARPGILAKELEKTLLYAGKNESVSEKDVSEVVGESKLENVFALTDALKTKNPEKALRLLNNQIDHGEEPIKILGTIAWQLRMIWQVKHYQQKKPAIRSDCESNGSQSLYSRKSFATHSPVQHTTTAQWIFGIGKRRSKSEVHYQGPHGSDANLDPQPLLLTAGATSNSIH